MQPDMSTSGVAWAGHDLVEAGGDRRELRRRRPAVGGLGEGDRSAGVAALGDGGLERHLAEQRNADRVGERLAAA